MNMRKNAGRKIPQRLLHMLLIGNPGCGKTTVARLIGRIYKEAGILREGHIVETNRAGLVGQYIGESERRTSEMIKMAAGGILYIDEIYSLVESADGTSSKDFGMKVIDTLMPVLSDSQSDIMVIGAGYPKNVKFFLEANPGLASRFPITLNFDDFSMEELMEIAHNHLTKYDFELSPEADEKLATLIKDSRSIKNHGNARMVITLIENHILPNLCTRLDKNTNVEINEISLITPEDIPDLATLFPLINKERSSIGFNR